MEMTTIEQPPPSNVVCQYLTHMGLRLKQYTGWCGCLTALVSLWLQKYGVSHRRLIITNKNQTEYLTPAINIPFSGWHYHAVIEIDGFIHCPWFDARITIDEYCSQLFPNQETNVVEEHITLN